MIKVGIVGTGNIVGISHFHAMSLLKDGRAEISAVYDVRTQAAAEWAREHGLNARSCASYEELLDSVDAVNICVPNVFHAQYALAAIKAGKHFLLEKPMAVSIEDCRALGEATRGYDKVNMIGFVYRYADAVIKARELVRGRLGRVYTYSTWFGGKRLADPSITREWRMERSRSGSGALGDFGSHLVDLADYVAGQRYSSVSAMTETFIRQRDGMEVENDDSAVFIAKGENGIGSYTMSRVGMDDVMALITGEGGMIQLSLRAPASLTYWEKTRTGAYTGKVENLQLAEQEPFAGWFDGEMSAYLDAIEGKVSDYPDIAQGLYVEEFLHMAERSSETKKEEKL